MAIKTYEEQLEEVQAAISAILSGGQSQAISGASGTRSLARADLRTLREMEAELREKIARQNRGGIRLTRAVPLG